MELPRHVIPKKLASGATAYYYNVPTKYRKLSCPIENEPLGKDFSEMQKRARTLNEQFDEWDKIRKGLPITGAPIMPKYGTVDWLFREYKISLAYREKVAKRSHGDYEWAMDEICNIVTKKGDRVGDRLVKNISPRAADKLYIKFIAMKPKRPKEANNDNAPADDEENAPLRLRTGEKLVGLCRKAWRVVHRLFPDEFDKKIPNPWTGVTLKVRAKAKKPAVTRDEVYTFAWGAIDEGYPEAAAVAVICFEWLQRPENVVAGCIKWSDYRSALAPTIINVEHHKTGTVAPHPLEERTKDGVVLFYAEAEEILARLPKLGLPMILRDLRREEDDADAVSARPWVYSSISHLVTRLRKKIDGVPAHFTFDACRHGGMTELEEAELTDGQGRALSTHKTQKSYEGYAKRTSKRMLSATRKRYAHRIANETATAIQNEASDSVQNGKQETMKSA